MKIMKVEEKFDNVFLIDGKLATVNLTPGQRVYGEELVRPTERSTGYGTHIAASRQQRSRGD